MLLVGVRFTPVGKIYHFDASDITTLIVGDAVVVETSRGCQIGYVAQILEGSKVPQEGGWKKIDRRATPRDLVLRETWKAKEAEIIEYSKERIKKQNVPGIKIVAADYSFDGAKLTVLFCSETDEKVDLKTLRQEVQRKYSPAQVEIRQIGPRDVSKLYCGMGACGLEARCCSKFLMEFSSISIRMAKEQGISLTPTEITGMCGRLRCCLIYEHEQYVEARKLLPKRNKRVKTPLGEGKVLDVSPIQETILVELPDAGIKVFKKDEVEFTLD